MAIYVTNGIHQIIEQVFQDRDKPKLMDLTAIFVYSNYKNENVNVIKNLI